LHFDSQQALIQAVIDAHLAGLRAHIESSIPASGGPEEQLAAFGLGYAEWALAKPGAYQLLFESGDALPMPAHAGPAEDSDRWYLLTRAGELLAAAYGLDASSAQLGAVRIWAAMHGIVSLRIHKTELDWPPIDGEVGHLITTYRATRLA
jgi:AcrR family transcriptional regulator